MKSTYVFIMAVAAIVLLAFIGSATADIPVNATPETKGITVTTNVNAQGTVTATDSLTWQQSSDALNAPPLLRGGFPAPDDDPVWAGVIAYVGYPDALFMMGSGEVQYTAGYSEQTMA